MTETFADSAAVKLKAGVNVSSALTAANYTTMINQAEAWFSENAKYDFVANSGAAYIATNIKPLLQDGVSSLAAFSAINYDMSGFTSRTEAQTMLDTNWTKVVEITNLLRDDKFREFLKRGTTE